MSAEANNQPLTARRCVPCESGLPPLTEEQSEVLRQQLEPEWHVYTDTGAAGDAIDKLRRVYVFKDFKEAMSFTTRVAQVAEAEGHHPVIHINYNRVTLTLWTHAIGGLSDNDFILAAKIDKL